MVQQDSPNHPCECEDKDLSTASHPVISPNGLWVQITCGYGHRWSVTRKVWEAELARRRNDREVVG